MRINQINGNLKYDQAKFSLLREDLYKLRKLNPFINELKNNVRNYEDIVKMKFGSVTAFEDALNEIQIYKI